MDQPHNAKISFADVGVDELPTVAQLAHRIWPSAYAGILSDAQIAYMLDTYYAIGELAEEVRHGVRFVFVRIDRQPVGFFAYGPSETPGAADLYKVYLLPEQQGRGVGSAMLQEALRRARDEGFATVSLFVNRRNERALRAYLRNGFRKTREVVTDIGHGFVKDDFVLTHELTRTASDRSAGNLP